MDSIRNLLPTMRQEITKLQERL